MDVTNDTGNYRHAITKSLHKNKKIKWVSQGKLTSIYTTKMQFNKKYIYILNYKICMVVGIPKFEILEQCYQ